MTGMNAARRAVQLLVRDTSFLGVREALDVVDLLTTDPELLQELADLAALERLIDPRRRRR